MDIFEVTILNWEKHQKARKDVENPSWFKMRHDVFDDPKMECLDPDQVFLWFFFLCQAGKANKGSFHVSYKTILTKTGIKKPRIDETVKTLISLNCASARHVDVTSPSRSRALDKRRGEETREEEIRTLSSFQKENALSSAPQTESAPLAKIWNENCGSLPKIAAMTGKRKAAAEARWREKPSTEYWTNIVHRVTKSEFLTGQSSGGWKANFDFFVRPDTHVKVSEGQYDRGDGIKTMSVADMLAGVKS